MTPPTENMKDMLRKMRKWNGRLKYTGTPSYTYTLLCNCIRTVEHTGTANGLISRKLVELKDGVYVLTTEGLNVEI